MTEPRLQSLLEGFVDDGLNENECGELIEWFDADPSHLSRFADELRLINALAVIHIAETEEIPRAVSDSLQPADPIVDIPQRVRLQLEGRSRKQPTRKRLAFPLSVRFSLAAAAILLVVVAGTLFREGRRDDNTLAAMVLRTNSTSGLKRGESFRSGDPIRFSNGRVVVKFLSGAKLAVEGPADLVVTGENSARLKRGIATVRVPGPIKGFTLDTPHQRVVDLGTSFGVSVADDGDTSIAVFEGEIELRGEQHVAGPQRLVAGKSVRVGQRDEYPQEIPHAINHYLGTWQVSFGVSDLVGDVRVATPTERQAPGQARDSDSLLLFPERENVRLSQGYVVDATQPGEHHRPFRKRTDRLGADVRVDSFLLQFNPIRNQNVSQEQTFQGELHFDRPIIALILQKDLLDASDAMLALPETEFDDIFRRGINASDAVTLSDDRQVLQVSFSVGNGVDQIRVLVATDEKSLK
ncbi:MAG: FecR domain-containing protein [Planctomycetota bacterium]